MCYAHVHLTNHHLKTILLMTDYKCRKHSPFTRTCNIGIVPVCVCNTHMTKLQPKTDILSVLMHVSAIVSTSRNQSRSVDALKIYITACIEKKKVLWSKRWLEVLPERGLSFSLWYTLCEPKFQYTVTNTHTDIRRSIRNPYTTVVPKLWLHDIPFQAHTETDFVRESN